MKFSSTMWKHIHLKPLPLRQGNPEFKEQIDTYLRRRVAGTVRDPLVESSSDDDDGPEIPPEIDVQYGVQRVLAKVRDAAVERRKQEISDTLSSIHDRVVLALKHYGMKGTIEITPSEHDSLNISTLTRGYNATEKRDQINHRQGLLQLVERYLTSCSQRKNIVQDIEDWFYTYNLDGVPTEDDLEETADFLRENNLSFEEAFSHMVTTVDGINTLGYRLLKEAGYIDSDDEDSPGPRRAKKFVMPQIKSVQDESQLLSDAANLALAMEDVRLSLDYAIRAVKTSKQKTVMRNAHKQFKFVIKAVDRRLTESLEKDETILQLEVEVNTLKNAKERLETDVLRKERKINKLDVQVINLESELSNVKEQQEILEEEVRELEEFKAKTEAEMIAPPSVQKVSVVSLRRESTRVRVVESTPELRALRAELEETRTALQEEIARGGELEQQLLEEQLKKTILESKEKLNIEEKVEREKQDEEDKQIQERAQKAVRKKPSNNMRSIADDSESLERQIARLKTELSCKEELIKFQEKSLQGMRQELDMLNGEYTTTTTTKTDAPVKDKDQDATKRLMVKINKKHEEEVNMLKLHLENEKKRIEADLRRLEHAHKEQLSNVHKQSIHLLRAINRFKGQVASILDRESLPDAATDVRTMPNLLIDDTHTDTRRLLAQMAGNAVELLVAIEFKLSQSLMNKRLEVKDNIYARTFATKDLEVQLTVTNKARQTAECMHEKLKETKQQLKQSEAALSELRKYQEKRFETLSGRNENLMSQYKTIQRQMAAMQNECGESLRRKEKQMKVMTRKRTDLNKLVEEQQSSINYMQTQLKRNFVETDLRYQLNINNQFENLIKIENAYKNGLITHEMHVMTAGLIKQFMTLPQLKLRMLVERYVAFRRLQDAKNQLETQQDEDLLADRKQDLTDHVERVDKHLTQVKNKWQDKREQLEKKRRELFKEMSKVFVEMVKTSELLHIRPIHVQRPNQPVISEGDDQSTTVTTTSLTSPRGQQPVLPHLAPSKLVGTGVKECKEEPMWKVEFPVLPATTNLRKTPALLNSHLLCLDVNSRRRAAERVLSKVRNREPLHMSYAESYDYEDCVVRSLQELLGRDDHLPPQRPTTPIRYHYINKPCQCGSLCSSNTCTNTKS